jgi:hypothetical protein
MADGTLKVGEITNSAGSGTITVPTAVTLQNNTPCLYVSKSASQTVSDNTFTKIVFETENAITTSGTWSSGNNRWTPGVAGTYFLTTIVMGYPDGQDAQTYQCCLYKNGSLMQDTTANMIDNYLKVSGSQALTTSITAVDVSATDYFESFVYCNTDGSNFIVQSQSGDSVRTFFTAHRLGV